MKTTRYNASRSSGHSVSVHDFSHDTHFVGIAVFDGFSMLPAAEVVDVFDKANQVLAAGPGGLPCYRTAFLSDRGECVSSSAQIDVLTQTVSQLPSLRVLFVACGELTSERTKDVRFNDWLREAACQADEVCAIGNGDSLLSAIGVAGRQFDARKQTGVSGDSSLNSAAGLGPRSAVRQALELVRQDFGVGVLRRVLELIPDTGLPEFNAIARDSAKSIRDKIHESAQWITRNCNKAISVTVAAQTAGMSERSYLRHFRAEMGIKPSEYLRRARVELAASMLESSDLPVDKIARRCGLTSGECLARLFRQVWEISPTEYRGRVRKAHEPRDSAIRSANIDRNHLMTNATHT
ncbi:helix-turn-helix domain-containing protein [Paraburkholderia sp. Tr-20389]|uniref:GlxA family transcriptional regulator n=1 Tax=Paraburkholderia sp. Tr-20389 TaxID=2703903 RepID=UPI00197FEC82|nr:helix-turn-helix domain-containing protein [Paraburkholderia sp. Tr-20389]MBN3756915.1 helix-turn-helix domain-containing protein [Paraburkholderia sp. Tr-20389]